MKFLLVPGNNSLSHVAKCAALEAALTGRGHSVLIAVTHQYSKFLGRLGLAQTILPDIQEADGGALPSMAWFRSLGLIEHCVRAEIDLIKAYRPDRVIGVFRFTLHVSAAVAGVPFDSLACGCMMPDMHEVLGCTADDPQAVEQSRYISNFYRFAARRVGCAMQRFGLAPIPDLRDLLLGDRTFLWDYPQFMPLPPRYGRSHVGPLTWERWPDSCEPSVPFSNTRRPLALVCLGTRPASRRVVEKAVRCLLACGYYVIVACGGQSRLMDILPENPRVKCWRFAPLARILRHADLIICHGGQMTIFESLQCGVPVLVVPSQPEQAHNGICLERIHCGLRLVPSIAFKGDTRTYADAFTALPDDCIIEKIQAIETNRALTAGLAEAREFLRRCDGSNTIADMMAVQ